MRPSSRTTVVAAWMVAVLAAPGTARAVREPEGRWLRIETDHVVLSSNAGESRSRAMVLRLEHLDRVLREVAPALDVRAPRPLRVWVFKETREFRDYAGKQGVPRGVGGLSFAAAEGDYVMIDAASESDTFGVLYHEYLHHRVGSAFPHMPLWLNEGLAEYFSTFWTNGYQAEIGGLIDDHVERLRSTAMLPPERLFEIEAHSPEYTEVEAKRRFHAQAWALTHFLLDDPRLRAALPDYLARVAGGEPGVAAFTGAFGTDVAGLRARLLRHLDRPGLSRRRIDDGHPLDDRALPVEVMATEDVLAGLGQLLAAGLPDGYRRAERLLGKALELDPEHDVALQAMGRLRQRQGRGDEARTYRRLSAAASHLRRGETDLGVELLRDALADARDAALIRELQLRIRAIDSRPD